MRFVELCLGTLPGVEVECCCGGTGRSAVGGLGRGLVFVGITCCMTAGARGMAKVSFAVVAGVIRI